jgi:hypothetical protein
MFDRAAPLLRKNLQSENSSQWESATTFQSNIEALTEIYYGGMKVPWDDINHLIIVAGHAISLDESDYTNDEAWVLESFQKGGQVNTFVEHIIKGVEFAKNDDQSLLVFSRYDVYHLELMIEVKHVHWLGLEVKDNLIGI